MTENHETINKLFNFPIIILNFHFYLYGTNSQQQQSHDGLFAG